MLKIGILTRCLGPRLKESLHKAADLQFDGVAVDLRSELPAAGLTQTAVREIKRRLEERGLELSAATFFTRSGLVDTQRSDQRISALSTALRGAYRMGARCLITNSGPLPNDTESAPWQHLVQSLLQLAHMSEREGACLALQTGGEDVERWRALLAELPEGLVGVDFHSGHLVAADRSPTEDLHVLGPRVVHVHACDRVRDFAQRSCVAVELGRGTVDWTALLAALEEVDFRGWLTVDPTEAAHPLDHARQAVQFLRSLA